MKKILFLVATLSVLFAGVEAEKNMIERDKVIKLNLMENKHRIRSISSESYAQLQPPSYANVYRIKRFNDQAKFYVWYADGKNFIRIEPQSDKFFACSASFAVIDNGTQRSIQLLQDDQSDSFCDDLYISATFRIKAYNFDPFDDTKPLTDIVYEGYDHGTKIYHLKAGVTAHGSSSQSVSSAPSCLPLLQTTTDPTTVKTTIKGKNFDINGFYIHYGNGAFDWIYVTRSSRKVYKLEKGVNDDYTLRWTYVNGISAEINGSSVTFK